MTSARIFISYRRDDAAGYAGRLEEALEARLGAGAVFRDVQDIPPGEDFVHAIVQRLAAAQAVLVLIGPRWAGAGPDGRRRIDDPADFVHQEVAAALASSARVVPVLLPGAQMPAAAELPAPLQPLARRNAMALSEAHWPADVARLLQLAGHAAPAAAEDAAAPGPRPPPGRPRRTGPLAAVAGLALLGVLAAGAAWLWPTPPTALPAQDASPAGAAAPALQGRWQARVRYDWGATHNEPFEFRLQGGQWTGSAGFLGLPRPIEDLVVEGRQLRFHTRTQQWLGSSSSELLHRYRGELQGQPPAERLLLWLQTEGSTAPSPPLAIEAQRLPDSP